MGDKTGIEWTDATWSPVTGCTRISEGCLNCYIERSAPIRMARRKFDGDGIGASLAIQLHPSRLDWPLRKRDGRKIFVCSQADLFHDDVPDEYIAKVWAVMALAPQHTFQVLTKRHGRMRALLSSERFPGLVYMAINALLEHGNPLRINDIAIMAALDGFARGQFKVLPNVWLGVSAEDQKYADLRIPALLDTPAAVRWISAEPLLGPINLYTDPIEAASPFWGSQLDWVVVGGESGTGARPMHPDWARSLRDQCVAAGVPFLFKQWGEWVTEDQSPQDIVLPGVSTLHWGDDQASAYKVGKKRAGRELDGRTWDQYPGPVAS